MKDEKNSLLSKIVKEYKKVIWPSKSETFQVTVIVLLITIFVALYVLVFDASFKFILSKIAEVIAKIFK